VSVINGLILEKKEGKQRSLSMFIKAKMSRVLGKRAEFGNNGEKHPDVVYVISLSQCVAADGGFM